MCSKKKQTNKQTDYKKCSSCLSKENETEMFLYGFGHLERSKNDKNPLSQVIFKLSSASVSKRVCLKLVSPALFFMQIEVIFVRLFLNNDLFWDKGEALLVKGQ